MKRAFILVLPILIAFFSVSASSAQTLTTESDAGVTNVFPTNVFGVGVVASLNTGMGLSFKQHIAYLPISYQLTGIILKTNGFEMYSFGGEIQYDLSLGFNRLYAVVGGGYIYFANPTNVIDNPTRFGAGLGYEIPCSRYVGMSLNLMITAIEPVGDIIPMPSIGFHAYFK